MKKRTKILFLLVWSIPLSGVLAAMLGLHFAAAKSEPLTGLARDAGFRVHHFLSAKCSCSRKLIDHLEKRSALAKIPEVVHLVEAQPAMIAALRAAGYEVIPVSEEDAVREFNLKALPQLVVMRDKDTLYQGGYGRDQQHSAVYEDESIIKGLLAQQSVREFPIFGCSNGKLAKNAFDLLGVKYGSE